MSKWIWLMLLILCRCGDNNVAQEDRRNPKPNILFIAVDDLRPDLGCYDHPIVQSPNIDQLSSDGIQFNSHYVIVPTCGASRFSLLTGRLPRSKAHLRNQIIADSIAPKPLSDIPESFIHRLKMAGYYTSGLGKISHMPDGFVYGYLDKPSNIPELPHSWNEFDFNSGVWGTGHNAFFGYADGSNRNTLNKQVFPYEAADVADTGYPDGLTTELALKKIQELKTKDNPFLLAVGFFKPHLPFNAPKSYWDIYDRKSIPVQSDIQLPQNVHTASLHQSGEFNQYALGQEKASLDHNVSVEYAKLLKHGYYACTSYIDAQIGIIIQALKEQDLYDNTLIVLWGDHGWHLGEHRVWGKHTLFNRSLNSPLIIKLPDSKRKSELIDAPVSTIDIYPTLLELCGVEGIAEIDGRSLVPLINQPETKWNHPCYGYFRNGISMTTSRYRLIQYFRDEQPQIELYDRKNDPDEIFNLAQESPEIVQKLMPLLNEGNTGLYDNN